VTFLAKVRKRPKLVLFGHKYTQGSRDGFRGELSPPLPHHLLPPPSFSTEWGSTLALGFIPGTTYD